MQPPQGDDGKTTTQSSSTVVSDSVNDRDMKIGTTAIGNRETSDSPNRESADEEERFNTMDSVDDDNRNRLLRRSTQGINRTMPQRVESEDDSGYSAADSDCESVTSTTEAENFTQQKEGLPLGPPTLRRGMSRQQRRRKQRLERSQGDSELSGAETDTVSPAQLKKALRTKHEGNDECESIG